MAAAPPAGRPTSYLQAMRGFSRNARLYLVYATMSQINSAIFLVAFAFYLEEIFQLGVALPGGISVGVFAFVGIALGVNAIAHGANSLPAGFIGDKYGRKRSFISASFIAIAAGAAVLFVAEPLTILGLAIIVGIGEAFHGVVGAPFMMENSTEEERIHLFTISGVLSTGSVVIGALLAGILPFLFQGWIAGLAPGTLGPLEFGSPLAIALRLTLFMAVPFGLAELIPLFFMKESYDPAPEPLREILALKHVKNKPTVAKLSVITLAYAAGLGLYFPLLNLHLEHEFHIHTAEFGPIIAVNNLAIALAILAVPFLVGRWGKVRTIVYTRLLAIPFLAALAFAPILVLAVVFFLLRGALSSMAFPVSGAFSMEVVEGHERATTAGFTHASFDLFFGATIFIAGFLLEVGGFALSFLVGGGLYLGHALLWYRWFGNHPVDVASRIPSAVVGGAR